MPTAGSWCDTFPIHMGWSCPLLQQMFVTFAYKCSLHFLAFLWWVGDLKKKKIVTAALISSDEHSQVFLLTVFDCNCWPKETLLLSGNLGLKESNFLEANER